MPRVLRLFRSPKRHHAMEELATAVLVTNSGVQGCAHARPNGKRQVLLVDRETLRAVNLAPGVIRENITTDGLDVNGLRIGQRLRVGESKLEVSAVCEPCRQLEKIRAGLEKEMAGRRAMLCRVLDGGAVRSGDSIELL